MKQCPVCAEEIQDEAIKCRFCGQILDLSVFQKDRVVASKLEVSQPDEEEDRLVTVDELAKILDVPKSWIYQRTQLGKQAIPHIKVGKYVRFSPTEVIEFFKGKSHE